MKTVKAYTSVLLMVLLTAAVFGQEKTKMLAVASGEAKQAAAKEEAAAVKEKPMAPMAHAECMHHMLCKQMVPASDGGVFILAGNKLMKYDANLALQKEVEVKEQQEAAEKPKAPEKPKAKAPEKPKAPEAKPAPAQK